MSLTALLVMIGSQWLSAQTPDPCSPPIVTICPDKFLPRPKAPKSNDPGMDPRSHIQKLMQEADKLRELEDAKMKVLEKTQAAYDYAKAIKSADQEEKLVALNKAKADENIARPLTYAAYNQAIAETIYFYHLTPPQTQFGPKDGPPVLNPIQKEMPPWKPRYSDMETKDANTGLWRRRDETNFEEEERQNAEKFQGTGMKASPILAKTAPDGSTIHIWAKAFEAVQERNKMVYDPDLLASTILHETVHWIYDMSRGGRASSPWDRLDSEAKANTAQANFLTHLGKDSSLVEPFSTAAKFYKDLASRCGSETCPEVPGRLVPGSDNAQGLDPGEPEPTRQSGDENFSDGVAQLDPITRQAKDFIEKEKQRRKEEAERRRNSDFFGRFKEAAYGCGFEPQIDEDNRLFGFRSYDTRESLKYSFTSEMPFPLSIDQIKTQFMLARACADADQAGLGVGAPCADAGDYAASRWKDKNFRSLLNLTTSKSQSDCLALLRDKLKSPNDVRAINDVLKRFVVEKQKEEEKERRRQERERRRRENNQPSQPSQPNQPSQPRQPQQPRQKPGCDPDPNVGWACPAYGP